MSNIRNTLLVSATCVSFLFTSAAFAETPKTDANASVGAGVTDTAVKADKKAAHKSKHASHKAKKEKATEK